MARKPKPLNERQIAMLASLEKCGPRSPFIPFTAADRSTVFALDNRGLLDGDLYATSAKATASGVLHNFTRGVWLNAKGMQTLEAAKAGEEMK